MRYVLKPIYERLGFDEVPGETHVELRHRERVLHQACLFNLDRCTNRAHMLYREWMRNKTLNL